MAKARSRAGYARAKARAGDEGMVCGYHDADGVPHYFVVPRGVSDQEVRQRAFEARNGRPMTNGEEMLDAAMNGDFLRAFDAAMGHYLGKTDAEDR